VVWPIKCNIQRKTIVLLTIEKRIQRESMIVCFWKRYPPRKELLNEATIRSHEDRGLILKVVTSKVTITSLHWLNQMYWNKSNSNRILKNSKEQIVPPFKRGIMYQFQRTFPQENNQPVRGEISNSGHCDLTTTQATVLFLKLLPEKHQSREPILQIIQQKEC
jgi:hypothetical protein